MDTVQLIKQKLSIVDVVTPYVKLTKAGRHYKGLSPFNKEKTPSFFVNPDRGSYFCFSSGQGGDMFTFVEKMEGVDFKGALKILAEKAGVPLVYQGNKDTGKTDRLREALARAEQFFAERLTEEGEAYQYALSRGLTKETIRTWNLGYAPDAWRELYENLVQNGFTTEELLQAGLIKEADGKAGTYYDRFRNRLMFPIKDTAGRTVAFTGRALEKEAQAKYLNSPETELFKKSEILFGMHLAKDAMRTRGFALLVEGQFDLLLLHQIGFQNTIALSGTALSTVHLSLIKRYSDNLMLALDADRAGLSASAKNAYAALLSHMRVKAVRLPQGKDPADLAKDTPQDLTRRIKESEPIIEFFLSVLRAQETDTIRFLSSVERIVLPLVSVMQSPLEKDHALTTISRYTGTSLEAVKEALKKHTVVREETVGERMQQLTQLKAPRPSSMKELYDMLLRATITAYEGTDLAKHLISEYARIIGTLPEDDSELPERVLFEVGMLFGESPEQDVGNDMVREFEKAVLTEALSEASTRLRFAEIEHDEETVRSALEECKDISKRLSALSHY